MFQIKEITRRCKTAILPFAVLSLLPIGSMAHHGAGAHYDLNTEVVFEAIITDLQLVNPHAYIYFDGLNTEGGLDPWRCELGTGSTLISSGWSKELLPTGSRVRVTGNPAWREDFVCKIETMDHESGNVIGFRGAPIQGTTDYVPSAASLAVSSSSDGAGPVVVLATGGTEAAERKIVDIPETGFYGHWQSAGGGVIGIAGGGGGRNNAELVSELALPTAFTAPAYTAAGQALFEQYDERFDQPALRCKSSVFDGMVHHGHPNEFVQDSNTTIRWVYGYMDLYREIHLDQTEHPENIERTQLGHSIAHWEGQTLVVSTENFSNQWLYNTGGNHVISSEEMTLVERITHDADNDHLVIEYVMNDPLFWEEPLSGVMRLSRADSAYKAYGCVELAGENNLREDGSTIFD